MPKSKCSLDLYTKFLISNHNRYSGVELSKTSGDRLSHDSISKWLGDKEFDSKSLWLHVKDMVEKETGYLIADDSVLDKRSSGNEKRTESSSIAERGASVERRSGDRGGGDEGAGDGGVHQKREGIERKCGGRRVVA